MPRPPAEREGGKVPGKLNIRAASTLSFAKLSAVSRMVSKVGFSRASRTSSSEVALKQISDSEQMAGPFADLVQNVDDSPPGIITSSGSVPKYGPSETPRPLLPPQPSLMASQPSGSRMGPAFLTSITALQEIMAAAAAPKGVNKRYEESFPLASWPHVGSTCHLNMSSL